MHIFAVLCIFAPLSINTVVPRPLSNDPRFTQCSYRYSRASKRFVEVYLYVTLINICLCNMYFKLCSADAQVGGKIVLYVFAPSVLRSRISRALCAYSV